MDGFVLVSSKIFCFCFVSIACFYIMLWQMSAGVGLKTALHIDLLCFFFTNKCHNYWKTCLLFCFIKMFNAWSVSKLKLEACLHNDLRVSRCRMYFYMVNKHEKKIYENKCTDIRAENHLNFVYYLDYMIKAIFSFCITHLPLLE